MKYFFLFILIALWSFPSMAHVTANPNNGKAGSYFETAFRVSHGCEGTDTVSVSIKMPKGMITAKPQFKSGWSVEVKKSKLDKAVPAGHGKMADEQVDEIIWSGGALPDGQYDTFGVLMKLPEKAGETLWFPVVQTCKTGTHEWTQVPGDGQQWHELKAPAPFVKIEAGPESNHKH